MPELFDRLLEVEAFLCVQQYSLLRLEDVVNVLEYLELCGIRRELDTLIVTNDLLFELDVESF